MATILPRPKTPAQAFNDGITPYIEGTKPVLDTVRRVDQISQKDNSLRDFSITLEDIDSAVFYYFKEVIKPYVIEDGNRIEVPIIYANPERWKSAQMDGNIRDKDGKILFPVITIKKVDISKVQTLGNKLDGNKAVNHYIVQQRYTKDNQYDNFSAILNRQPVKKFQVITIPDYHKITYNCEVHVNNQRDLDKILEAVTYASHSYWGDPKKFNFMTMIDSIPISREVVVGDNKKVYAVFDIVLNGYIIPDSINHYMSTNPTFYSKAQVNFTAETVRLVNTKSKAVSSTSVNYSESSTTANKEIIVEENVYLVSPPDRVVINNNTAWVEYSNLSFTKQAISIDIFSDRFYLRGVTLAIAPTGVRDTSINDFTVSVNGQTIPTTDIISITQIGPDVEVIFSTDGLGYTLLTTFEITVKGKFTS